MTATTFRNDSRDLNGHKKTLAQCMLATVARRGLTDNVLNAHHFGILWLVHTMFFSSVATKTKRTHRVHKQTKFTHPALSTQIDRIK